MEKKEESISDKATRLVDEELKNLMNMKYDFVNFVEMVLVDKKLKKLGAIDARLIICEMLKFMVKSECDHPSEYREMICDRIEERMRKHEEVKWDDVQHFFEDIEDEMEQKILKEWGQMIVNHIVHWKEIPTTRLRKHDNQIFEWTMAFVRKNKTYLSSHLEEESDEEAYAEVTALLKGNGG